MAIVEGEAQKVSKYDFVFTDKNGEEVVVENLNKSFDPEYWNYAKLVSGILRHGMPLTHVIDLIYSLDLHAESLNNWKNGVVRMIKKYIKDEEKPNDTKCPKCGAEDGLIFQEGCLICKECAESKCS